MVGGASIRGIKAGSAFVEILNDDSKLMKGLKQTQKKLQAFGKTVSNAGAGMMAGGTAIVAPILAAAKHFMTVGDNLDEMAARTGMSTNALSELGYAADQSGTDIETVEKSVRKMQGTIAGASKGGKTYASALAEVGTSWEQLQSLSPEQQFERIAAGLNNINDPTMRAAAAMKIFGKGGTALLPMINDLDALRAKAVELGLSIGPEQAKNAALLADAWGNVKGALSGVATTVGAALAPLLTSLADKITFGVIAVRKWIAENKTFVTYALYTGVALIVAGAAVFLFGQAIIFAGSVISGFLAIMAVIGPIAAAVGSALLAAFTFLISPIGLALIAVVALGAAFLYFSGIGGKVCAWLGQQWQSLKDTVLKGVQGMGDALMAGDIQLAAEIMWTMLKMAWQKGTGWLSSIWNEVVFTFSSVWTACVYGLQTAWQETQSFLASGFLYLGSVFERVWNNLTAYAQKAWNKIKGFFSSSVDSKALNAEVDKQLAKKQAALTSQTDTALAGIEQERQANKKARDEQYNQDAGAASKKQTDAEVAIKAEADALRGQFDALRGKAAKERADAEKTGKGIFKKFQIPGMPAMAAASEKMSILGTFSGAAAGLMGRAGPSAIDKVAANTQKIADNTGETNDKLDELDQEWGE